MELIKCTLPPPMTKEEKETFYREWNENSWKTLVERNMRLATEVANKFHNTGIEYEDLISISMVGLVNAAKKFNPDLGYEFSTYAIPAIRNQILQEIRRMQNHPYPNVSINEFVYDSNNGRIVEKADLIPSDFDMEEYMIGGRLGDIIDTEIRKENKRNQKIIRLFLDGIKQREIGDIAGVSQPQVNHITKKFRDKIKKIYMN